MGPVDCQRTLWRITDDIAAIDPHRLFCTQPVSSDISQGWRDISFSDMASAANRMALWLQENVASSTQQETLAYVGTNDIRYVAFILACMKLRHKALLLSTRNSVAVSQHLLTSTGCTKLVFTTERSRQIKDIVAAGSSIQIWEVSSLWDILNKEAPAPNLQELTEESEDRIAFYIHSSGTTGIPKPVPITNGYLLAIEQIILLQPPEGRTGGLFMFLQNSRSLAMAPFFHLMGIFNVTLPIFFSTPFILTPDRPLTVKIFAQIVQDQKPQTGVFIPTILEAFGRSDLGTRCLKEFESVVFGGAALTPEIGKHIAGLTHLQTIFGSTECGVFGSLKPEDKEDWQYFEPNPNAGISMQDTGGGLYELVVTRGKSRSAHCVFHTYPDKQVYHTRDLFVRHPRKDNLWLFSGRADDIIVLSNGEKFNPTTMEQIIIGHPLINLAIVLGQGYFQPSVLIEPDWNTWSGDPYDLINEIWSTIEKANQTAPGHAQLMKSHVGISSQSKPFQLTPKGTVKRQATLTDYEKEISDLYAKAVMPDVAQLPSTPP